MGNFNETPFELMYQFQNLAKYFEVFVAEGSSKIVLFTKNIFGFDVELKRLLNFKCNLMSRQNTCSMDRNKYF